MLIQRMWINQPSSLQSYNMYHGKRVLAVYEAGEKDKFCRIWFTEVTEDFNVSNMEIESNALSLGWKYE